MEGIDLAGVVDSDFQGIQINFAPPRPAGFANFRGAGQDLLFCGAGQPFFRSLDLRFKTFLNKNPPTNEQYEEPSKHIVSIGNHEKGMINSFFRRSQ